MDRYEKVPWSCREEWEYCRDRLSSNDLVMQQKALEHLYVWKIRNSSLPIGVECTLILMESKIRATNLLKNENIPDMSVAMWFSTPIVRFVNLVTDPNGGAKTPSSMMEAARKLNIPDWIVELRHEISHHHSLPKLSKVKEAMDVCWRWLQDYYWQKGLGSDNSESVESRNVVSPLYRYFDAYRIIKLRSLQGYNILADLDNDEKRVVLDVIPDKVKQDEEHSLDSWSLADAYEVVFKKLSRLLNHEKYAKELVDRIVTTDNQKFDLSADVLENDIFLLPDMLEKNGLEIAMKKWADLLNVLCNSAHLILLLKKLFHVIGDESEYTYHKECAFAYANAILESICLCKKQSPDEKTNSRKKRKLQAQEDRHQKLTALIVNSAPTDEQIKELMLMITKNPNQFSEEILNSLCRISESDSILLAAKKFSRLIDIYAGKTLPSELSKSKISGNSELKIHTVQELRELLGIASEPMTTDSIDGSSYPPSEFIASQSGKTIVEEATMWSNIPLGFLPGQTEFHLWRKIYDLDETDLCDE